MRGGALLCSHATLEDDRIVPSCFERCREVVDVAGALGEDEAVSTTPEGPYHVGEDLLVSRLVLGERVVDAGDRTRRGEVDRLVQVE